ncbi:MAG: TVP38/TMEM64 family protein [Bdellovibrionota bacterium]
MKRISFKKIVTLVVIIVLVTAIYKTGLLEKLNLEYIKSSQADFLKIYHEQPFLIISIFFLAYVLSTALSLPGAVVLTLAGGGVFGFWLGTLIVSFASTIGATLACLGSRFILRDWVQGKFGEKIKAINDGIAKEGAFYLFTLRLVPIFPFFMINLVLGLTKMRIWTFFWVSQLGMLAGTMVYVNAGKELAKIDSLGGILSPRLLLSFAILGIFPILVKKIVAKLQKSQKVIEHSK